MKLTSAEGNILAKSKFRAWITYVDDLNNKTPSQAKSAASVLTENFYDNAVLSKMLNIAMKDKSTQTLAIKLQGQRLENWKTGNVDPLRVLQLLKLDQRDILKNPMLVSWMKYMDDFNARNPTKKMTMFDTFSHYLMNDRRLAKLLETGQKIPATKEISLALQLEWFAKWERMKFTPNDAFKAVGLKGTYEATGPLLSDPALYFWARYLTEFNQKHPSARTSLIDTLRRNYADEAIVDMIVAAKVVPTTKHSAENLELSLLRKWVLEKKNPVTIGRWLLADKSGAMYTKYEAYYNAKWAAGA
ncbi:RxLR effector protein [Phytophthora megakarya]|uniref:RxLR effector protein n=1 Tax=Phytophthora megakarya TaxID=4795 RepID=A0A225VM94_9STRA|nr:RxLR effector protein [Phytophthora megakarya]